MTPRRAVLAVLTAVAAVACAARSDYTPQIEVSGSAAANACRLMPSRCPSPARAAAARAPERSARVHPLRAGEELGGPNATGRPGDWVLENDEVVFVIDGLGGGGGFAESGGNLVDAADARARRDELGLVFTYFGAFPRQGVYDAIDARTEPDGTAVVVARGRELHEKDVRVETEYRLAPGDRALLLRTTLTNDGRAKIDIPGLGDAVQWGGTEKVAPGKPVGFRGTSKGPYLGGVGRFASYAITSTEGEIGAISGGAWSDTVQREAFALEPGARATYERVLVVGERPDTSSLVAELSKAAGLPLAKIEIALAQPDGTRLAEAPEGAKVLLANAAGEPIVSVVAARPREGGPVTFIAEVPPMPYLASLAAHAGWKGDGGPPVPIDARGTGTARATVKGVRGETVTFSACVDARSKEPLPCKLTIEGEGGTATPDFGPGHVAGPAKNQIVVGVTGAHAVTLPAGRYRVTASRGPEYELEARTIDVPGGAVPAFALTRVLATPGYVSTDFHQHTVFSADAPVATRDRLLANAAEGVEVAVASEHNNVVDLAPIVKELRLEPFTVSVPGNELTTDASRAPWGHANVYPVPVRDAPRGGAPNVRDRGPAELFAEARALPGGPRVVQVNHPRSGSNGYFDLLGFDPKTGQAANPAWAADFDALEVWNGRNVEARGKILDDLFALARGGKKVTAIAATDTHGIVGQEAGYPRTYVRVAKDDALASWDAARTADLVEGVRTARDVVLTSGPFLELRARGASGGAVGIGGTVKGARVEVEVVVRSARWTEVDTLEVRRADPDAKVPAPIKLTATTTATGAREARARFTLTGARKGPDAFVVVARGGKPMRPVLAGDDAEIAPWAMTGAVWLEP